MQPTKPLVAILFTLPLAATGNELHMISESDCKVREGQIQIEITGNSRSWSYQWADNRLTLKKRHWKAFSTVGIEPLGSVYGNFIYQSMYIEGIKRDLLGDSTQLNAPFAISPNKQSLVATIYPAHSAISWSPQKRFVIVNMLKNAPVRIVDTQHELGAFAWSPSGDYIAALLSEDVDAWKSPVEKLAASTGHGVPYYSLYVALFLKDGTFNCMRLVRKRERYGSGYVVWKAQ